MVLEAFACTAFSITEFTKTQHYSLEENTKEKILTDGLYHFTSKDVAKKIVNDGYFRPTKGLLQNHFGKDKVYMFYCGNHYGMEGIGYAELVEE